MADLFAKHYSDKVNTLQSQKRRPPNIDPVVRLGRALFQRGTSSASDLPPEYYELECVTLTQGFTANELKELLKPIKGGKALGGDELDCYLIKTASKVILLALLHIISLSIKERQFMDRWKVEVVVPHFKKGSKHLLDNYQPVRHLIEVGKLVELTVWDQMMSYCMQQRVLHPNHHGTLPWHSTPPALAQLHDTITAATE